MGGHNQRHSCLPHRGCHAPQAPTSNGWVQGLQQVVKQRAQFTSHSSSLHHQSADQGHTSKGAVAMMPPTLWQPWVGVTRQKCKGPHHFSPLFCSEKNDKAGAWARCSEFSSDWTGGTSRPRRSMCPCVHFGKFQLLGLFGRLQGRHGQQGFDQGLEEAQAGQWLSPPCQCGVGSPLHPCAPSCGVC